ncbi:MAG TPA: peptidoglycan bridge formation glycyltransferase FemA/FemB family protein [Candidatus Bathyarchaeia archaeon]|nr:peptidoglycan bridge formation glycyltransferase FemA/FemB family protein [Candidatus Bathyarchaeia archaeon]
MISNPLDLRQSPNYAVYLEKIGWQVEKTEGVQVFIRKIPLTPFSILKLQRPKHLPSPETIGKISRKYRALFAYIEPDLDQEPETSLYKKYGYKISKSPFLPTKTVVLDLNQSDYKLTRQLKKDTRLVLKKLRQKPDLKTLICSQDDEILSFYRSWKKAAGWQLIIPAFKTIGSLKSSFSEKAIFLAAYQNKQSNIIAGTIILLAGQTAYYFYAFTSKKGRRLLAQYGLVWEAIKIAKNKGCRNFDFEGIFDLRFPQKSWLGFSHFKKSFGGKEIGYPGCYRKNLLFGQ